MWIVQWHLVHSVLCSLHFWNVFSTPRGNLAPMKQSLSVFPSPGPRSHLSAVSVDISSRWSHTACGLSCVRAACLSVAEWYSMTSCVPCVYPVLCRWAFGWFPHRGSYDQCHRESQPRICEPDFSSYGCLPRSGLRSQLRLTLWGTSHSSRTDHRTVPKPVAKDSSFSTALSKLVIFPTPHPNSHSNGLNNTNF